MHQEIGAIPGRAFARQCSLKHKTPALQAISHTLRITIGGLDELFVLGGPVRRLDGLDLRALQMQMTRQQEVVSKGTGAACLGNPLNAMAWLASELVRRKRPLRAGE
jgi:2-keto-4-pentenoate hydratase